MNTDQLRERVIKRLKELQALDDPECAHSAADEALCELLRALGLGDVVEEWEKVERWYN